MNDFNQKITETAFNTLAGCVIVDAESLEDGRVRIRLYNPEIEFFRHLYINDASSVELSWALFNEYGQVNCKEVI